MEPMRELSDGPLHAFLFESYPERTLGSTLKWRERTMYVVYDLPGARSSFDEDATRSATS